MVKLWHYRSVGLWSNLWRLRDDVGVHQKRC
jgi:hypothetical protein